MYPGQNTVPTKRQRSGDKAEKERDTVRSLAPHGEDNPISGNDLIFLYRQPGGLVVCIACSGILYDENWIIPGTVTHYQSKLTERVS